MVGRLREDRAVDDVTRVAATARLKLLDVAGIKELLLWYVS